jgi:hypothetical protein
MNVIFYNIKNRDVIERGVHGDSLYLNRDLLFEHQNTETLKF